MATAPNYCCGGWALVTSRTNETTLVLSEALIRLSLYHPRIWPSLSFNDFLIRKYVFCNSLFLTIPPLWLYYYYIIFVFLIVFPSFQKKKIMLMCFYFPSKQQMKREMWPKLWWLDGARETEKCHQYISETLCQLVLCYPLALNMTLFPFSVFDIRSHAQSFFWGVGKLRCAMSPVPSFPIMLVHTYLLPLTQNKTQV